MLKLFNDISSSIQTYVKTFIICYKISFLLFYLINWYNQGSIILQRERKIEKGSKRKRKIITQNRTFIIIYYLIKVLYFGNLGKCCFFSLNFSSQLNYTNYRNNLLKYTRERKREYAFSLRLLVSSLKKHFSLNRRARTTTKHATGINAGFSRQNVKWWRTRVAIPLLQPCHGDCQFKCRAQQCAFCQSGRKSRRY